MSTVAPAAVETAIGVQPGRMAGQEKHMVVEPPEEYECAYAYPEDEMAGGY